MKVLERTRKQARKKLIRLAGKETVNKALPAGGFDRQLLETTSSAFTQVWILHTLDRLRAPLPQIYNRDGEQFVFTETRFPVDTDRRQEIIERLDAAAQWDRGDGQTLLWTWLAESGESPGKPNDGLSSGSFGEGPRPTLGTLELKSNMLMLTTNSMERTERGKETIAALLEDLIGPSLTKLQTAEQWWPGTESNCRHGDFQSPALPTELPGRLSITYLLRP